MQTLQTRTRILVLLLLTIGFQSQAQKARLVIPSGHTNPVITMTLSQDEKILASAEGLPGFKLWDAESGKELFSLQGHTEAVNEVAFQPNGSLLASASNDKTIILWDARKAIKRMVLSGHKDAVTGIRFTKDGTKLISASYDGTLKVWNLTDGSMALDIPIGSPVHCLSLSAKEDYVVCGTRNGDIFLVDLSSGQKANSLKLGTTINDVQFSPDDKWVVVADNAGKISVANMATPAITKTIPAFSFRASKVVFTDQPSIILAVGRDAKKNVAFFDITSGQPVKAETVLDVTNTTNFEIGINTVLLNTAKSKLYLPDYSSGVRVINLKDNKLVGSLHGKARPIVSFSIDPSGKYMAVASNREDILIMDLTGASDARFLSGHTGWVKSVAFHPTQKRLVSAADDGKIMIWDTENWILKSTITTEAPFAGTSINFDTTTNGFYKKASMSGIDFYELNSKNKSKLDLKDIFDFRVSADGKTLAAKSMNTLTFYPGPKFKKGSKLTIPNIAHYDFFPNGTQVITVDGQSIKIFDVATKKEVKTIPLTGGAGADHVKLVPERNLALTWNTAVNKFGTSADNTVKAWSLESGELIANLEGHSAAITALDVLNGQFVFSSSMDGTMCIWSLLEKEASKAHKASLVPLDEKNWVVTTGIGLFDATGPAMLDLHYVQHTEIIDINQLKDKYYEPSLLPKILGYNHEPIRTASELSQLSLYPEINLLHPSLNNGKLGIELKEQGGGYGRVVVLINDKEVAQNVRDVVPIDKAQPEVTISYNMANHPYLKEGDVNKISVKVYNENGDLVSSTKSVYLLPDANAAKAKPKLYALLSGVSDYQGTEIDLKYAAKDAADMADALKLSASKYVGDDNTTIQLLTTDNKDPKLLPTKQNIKRVMAEFAAKANANDILFIYFSGHGINYGGEEGDFYYLTADAKNGVMTDPAVRKSVALSSAEITEMITAVPAIKQVMIIDACHAARLATDLLKKQTTMNSSEVRALETMKDKTGLYVLAGSAADAVSYEASSYGQGLLTYSLLFGIKGPALRNDEYVDVMRLFQFATEKVPQLVAGIGGVQKPEMRVPTAASSFDIGQVSEVERNKIHLANPKPVFIQSQVLAEADDFDGLELGAAIDSEFRNISASGTGKIDFINERKFSGAITVRGRYVQKEGNITAKIKLYKDGQMVQEFESSGASVDVLAKAIVDAALKVVIKS